jgi:HemY protein
MIRLLIWLLFIGFIGAGAAWVAEHPGDVTIYWFDLRIDTSFAFLLAAVLIFAFLFAYLLIFVRWLARLPVHFSERRNIRHYSKGLTEITYSVAALAASDVKAAEKHTRKAEKLLGSTPLTLLLSAQIARSQGDESKTRQLLEQMLDHKETEYLAARSLSESASKQQQFSAALPLAERASKVNPREKAPVAALVGLHTRLGQWQEALNAIDKAYRKGALKRSEMHYYKGLVHVRQGEALLDNGQADAALAHARICLKHMPEFLPAVIFAARAHHASGRSDKALKLIFSQWRKEPHPELASLMRIVMAKDTEAKQLKYAGKLVALAPEHPESQLALAEVAIKFKQWETARAALKAALAQEESVRACKLMAYVEQGEFSDYDASGRWLARSSEALTDPVWMCSACASVSEHWQSHCAECASFDTLSWKKREIRFVD